MIDGGKWGVLVLPVGPLLLLTCQAVGFLTSSEVIAYKNRRLKFYTLRLGTLIGLIAWVTLSAYFCTLCLKHAQISNVVIAECEMLVFPILVHVDISVRKVPTSLLSLGSGIVCLALAFSDGHEAIMKALLFTITYCAPFVVLKSFSGQAIGSGDIRLGILLGPILSNGFSVVAVPMMLLVACMLVVIFVVEVRLFRGVKSQRVAFVPFLVAAVIVLQIAQGCHSY